MAGLQNLQLPDGRYFFYFTPLLHTPVFTARIRRMGKVIFSVCFSVYTRGWGVLQSQVLSQALVPCPFWGRGVRQSWPGGWGVPQYGAHILCYTHQDRTGVPPGQGRMGYPQTGWIPPSPPTRTGVPPARSGLGYPLARPRRGTPSQNWGTPQVRMGYIPLAKTGLAYPSPLGRVRVGTPPPPRLQDRTAERTLATRRTVCLLRSRRRTFLFTFCTQPYSCISMLQLDCLNFRSSVIRFCW